MRTGQDVYQQLEKCSCWKIPILFGALKHHKVYFWTNEEIRDINETYYKDLLTYNHFFPIPKLSLFRVKQKGEVNSFFYDVGKDPQYLKMVIWGIEHNLDLLFDIITIFKDFDWNQKLEQGSKKKTATDMFYDSVSSLVSQRKPNLKWYYDWKDRTEFNFPIVRKDTTLSEKYIKEAFESVKSGYKFVGDDPYDDGSYEFEIIVDGSPLKLDKDFCYLPLTDKAAKLFANNLEGIEETLDIDTGRCMMANLYFFSGKWRSMGKFLNKNFMLFNSPFKSVIIDIMVATIRKFYVSFTSFYSKLSIARKEEEEQRCIQTITKY